MRLRDRIAIVTGAASGFGAEIARRFAAEGARVVIADIDAKGGAAVAREIGESALAVRCDVTDRAEIAACVAVAVDRFGGLDILVNNAGWTHVNRPLTEVSEGDFDRVFAVNVKSIYLTALAVVPLMQAQGRGVILNIGSVGGIRPRPGLAWYSASKGAVNLLSKAMAIELAPHGIRVNAICPVLGTTGLLERFMGMPDTPENRQRFMGSIPLGRFAEPADVANAAVHLASDEAAFVTGIEYPVDGGRAI